jgi:hypothetical protein
MYDLGDTQIKKRDRDSEDIISLKYFNQSFTTGGY